MINTEAALKVIVMRWAPTHDPQCRTNMKSVGTVQQERDYQKALAGEGSPPCSCGLAGALKKVGL